MPSKRTPEVEQEILERMSRGEPLAEICRSDPKFPHPTTWNDWCAADPALNIAHGRARDAGYDAIAAETLAIADDARNDWMKRHGKDGETESAFNAEHVQRSKLRIETRLKLLAKWDPRRYGDKLAIGGADDLPPIKTATDEQLMARIRALQAKLNGAEQG